MIIVNTIGEEGRIRPRGSVENEVLNSLCNSSYCVARLRCWDCPQDKESYVFGRQEWGRNRTQISARLEPGAKRWARVVSTRSQLILFHDLVNLASLHTRYAPSDTLSFSLDNGDRKADRGERVKRALQVGLKTKVVGGSPTILEATSENQIPLYSWCVMSPLTLCLLSRTHPPSTPVEVSSHGQWVRTDEWCSD